MLHSWYSRVQTSERLLEKNFKRWMRWHCECTDHRFARKYSICRTPSQDKNSWKRAIDVNFFWRYIELNRKAPEKRKKMKRTSVRDRWLVHDHSHHPSHLTLSDMSGHTSLKYSVFIFSGHFVRQAWWRGKEAKRQNGRTKSQKKNLSRDMCQLDLVLLLFVSWNIIIADVVFGRAYYYTAMCST